jgi:hypothetical protein
MSGRIGVAFSPGLVTITGGSLLVPASFGARRLTHVETAITAQNSVADAREMRATLPHCSQNRSSSAL